MRFERVSVSPSRRTLVLRTLVLASLVVLASACAGVQKAARPALEVTPATLYPLAEGNAWSYDVETGDGDSVLAVARVARKVGEIAEVVTGASDALRYEPKADGIARVGSDGYLLKAPLDKGASWASGAGRTALVSEVDVRFSSRAGSFDACVVIDEREAASGQRTFTTYCPGVGPVLVVSEMDVRGQTLRVVARLRGYDVSASSHADAGAP
jgi:hypothetical protein